MNSIMRIHNSGVTCEPHCYLALSTWSVWTGTHFHMCKKKKPAIIILEILHTTVTNLVAWDLCTLTLLCTTPITSSTQQACKSAPQWIWYNKYS